MKKYFVMLCLCLFMAGNVYASGDTFLGIQKYDKNGNSNVEKVLGVSGMFITFISLLVIFDSPRQPKVNRSITEGTSLCAGAFMFNKFVLKF